MKWGNLSGATNLKTLETCAHILRNAWSISPLMIEFSSESVASAIKQMCPISGEAQPRCGELAKLQNLESTAYVAILFPFSLHLQKM